jgi:hypothetical protein
LNFVQFFLEQGIVPTPDHLILAASHAHDKLVELFLKLGLPADAEVERTALDKSLVHIGNDKPNPPVVSPLISHGAEIKN